MEALSLSFLGYKVVLAILGLLRTMLQSCLDRTFQSQQRSFVMGFTAQRLTRAKQREFISERERGTSRNVSAKLWLVSRLNWPLCSVTSTLHCSKWACKAQRF